MTAVAVRQRMIDKGSRVRRVLWSCSFSRLRDVMSTEMTGDVEGH